MIPVSAITVKPAAQLGVGEIGLLLAREKRFPVIGGTTQDNVLVAVIFDGDTVRVEPPASMHGPILVIAGAEIVVDPESGVKADPGRELGCPILSGGTLSIEADYQMNFHQVALGPVAQTSKGDRIAFPRWRIVLRHDGTKYEVLNRAPAAE